MQSSFMKDKRPALGPPKAGKNKGKALVLWMNFIYMAETAKRRTVEDNTK